MGKINFKLTIYINMALSEREDQILLYVEASHEHGIGKILIF
jgi:hypothetical protein